MILGKEMVDDDTDTLAAIGNIGRYINHSCNPNLTMIPVRVDTMVPHLALFVRREVKLGEELCFDYGDFDRKNSTGEVLRDNVVRTPCLCSSVHCAGLLPFDSSLL